MRRMSKSCNIFKPRKYASFIGNIVFHLFVKIGLKQKTQIEQIAEWSNEVLTHFSEDFQRALFFHKVKRMKRNVILCMFMGIVGGIHAQQPIEVSGIVTDSLNTPLKQTALVMVVNKETLAKVVSGEYHTTFRVNYMPEPGKAYLLYVFVPGYKDRYMEITGKHGNLGIIPLAELSQRLKEVVIKADALPHEVVFGDDVYKISGSVLANEYSLYTLLSRIPGLFVNGERVEIVGAGTPVFTINGQKPRPGELDMITPEEIEKVVVNRAPSVKYGNSVKGVIDIRMKKKLRDYLSAKIRNDVELGNRYTQNKSVLQINHKDGKWTNYLGYTYNLGKNRCDLYDQKETIVDVDKFTEISKEIEKHHGIGHQLTVSPKYQINDKSYVDVQYNYGTQNRNARTFTDGMRQNLLGDLREKIDKQSNQDADNPTHQVAARYYTEWKNGNTFVTNVSYANLKTESTQYIDEQINIDSQATQVKSNARSRVYTVDMDYLLTLASRLRLNVGGEYAFIQNDTRNVYDGNNLDGRSFNTDTKDYMGSLYADLRFVESKFMFAGGVRGEYNRRSDLYNEKNNFHSLDFSPRLKVSYNFSPVTSLSLNYNFMLQRPSMSQLNPNPIYVNKYLYIAGNPDLKLAKVHAAGLGIRLPAHISLDVSYRYIKNNIFKAFMSDKENPEVIVFSYSNLEKSQNLMFSASYWGTWSWYTFLLNGMYSKPFIKAPYMDEMMRYNKPYYVIHNQHMFRFNNGLSGSVSFHYYSKSESFPSNTEAHFNIGGDLYYKYKQWNFRLSCDNLIYKKIVPTTQKYLNIYNRQEADLHLRYVEIGITYRFSKFKELFQRNNSGDGARQRAN